MGGNVLQELLFLEGQLVMGVGVGIATYGGHFRVESLLQSFMYRDHGIDPSEIHIVVSNDGHPTGISDKSRELAYQLCNQGFVASILDRTFNIGVPGTWNELTDFLFGDPRVSSVFLLNDDVMLEDYWLRNGVYFLEHSDPVGAVGFDCYWFDPPDVPGLIENPLLVQPRNHDKRDLDAQGLRKHIARRPDSNAPPGRVMAANGFAFGFTRDSWDISEKFPEEFIAFHEESHQATFMASKGRPSYIIKWPVLWHQWSATFHDCRKEINASAIMKRSRKLYCEKWGVPEKFSMSPFDFTHPKYMAMIPERKVAWMAPAGPMEAIDPPCQCPWCQEVRNAGS
ncbi:MAG: hypothetical protein UY48_C0003G0099 [Candidatus Gottesmanbacteria bacterium GW2011_GWB1_49_7]|uniref:Glycosyltransferase 2-like domain-containing protein n=1 Tax=Candidatus Gottesmanbacteria bacterium GW2011_GWB1_49_7 TaxID=1618448 RepID=A0A0G1YE94_9BACT|nr:MAG: hypothetical protein UY48_C0003G0099 [Candidatus Gottesmanbacteria bacterium GW2011_GWB1_49_7]